MEKLKSLGLNKYETNAYIGLLRMGITTAYKLSENSDVPFGRVYEILDKLENKGLVTLESTDPKKYEAVDPEIGLRALLNEKDKEWQEKKEEIEELINSLEYKDKELEEVKFVKSKEVYYKKLEQLMDEAEKEMLCVAGNLSAGETTNAKKYMLKFTETGGTNKMLVRITDKNRDNVKEAFEKGVELKRSPFEGLRLYIIDGKKVMIAVNKPAMLFERAALIVEDTDFAESMKRMFLSVWEKQEKLNIEE